MRLYNPKPTIAETKSTLKKYHIQKGFPKTIILPKNKYLLTYSTHAKREAKNDINAPENLILPTFIDFSSCCIFEIETENGLLKKVLCRCKHNEFVDLVLAITLDGYLVNTLWFNLTTDTHSTIDFTKYNRAKW